MNPNATGNWTPTALACSHCDHGWHALGCSAYVVAGGIAAPCRCPNSAPNVPNAAEYLNGRRNPLAAR